MSSKAFLQLLMGSGADFKNILFTKWKKAYHVDIS